MNRTARDKNDAFRPAPVTRITLNPQNEVLRFILFALALAVAVAAFSYGISQLFAQETGWREITSETKELSCVQDFHVVYDIGAAGASASAEYRAIRSVYDNAAVHAYRVFNPDQAFEDIGNLYSVNSHVNEPIEVDPVLYGALEKIHASGNRSIYLAPVFEQYQNLFFCNDEGETANYDPFVNAEIAAYFAEICAFANDPSQIDLELLDGSRVVLHVSQDFLDYAKENGITTYLDFFWMKNAFIADYLAKEFTDAGYTFCAISSVDGFGIVLDNRGSNFNTEILDRTESGAYAAGRLSHSGERATVALHDYDLSGRPDKMFFALSSGQIRTPYIDPFDGFCKSAVHDLTVYSNQLSCADLLLQVCPIYISEELDENALNALAKNGTYAVFCRDRKICYNEPDAVFADVYTSEALSYVPMYNGK